MNSIESLITGHKLIELLGAVALFVVYILPTTIAIKRRCRKAVSIAVVNVVTGVTGLGWFVAFIWSLIDDVDDSLPAKKFKSVFLWVLGLVFYMVSALALTNAALGCMPYSDRWHDEIILSLGIAAGTAFAGYGVRLFARQFD